MNTVKFLSQRLFQLRTKFGLTQESFAETAGFDYKFYQAIEAGRKKQIWIETVERLAASYDLHLWELLAPAEPTAAKKPGSFKITPAADPTITQVRRKPGRPKGIKKAVLKKLPRPQSD